MSDETLAKAGDLFSHTTGRSSRLLYIAIFLAVFTIPIVAIRLWTSKNIARRWHTDDTLIVIATILGVFQSVIVCVQARLGAGDHIINISLEGLGILLEIAQWGGVSVHTLTNLFIKASILFFYLRFTVDAPFRTTTYIVLVVLVVSSMVSVIGAFTLNCSAGQPGDCRHLFHILIAGAAFNVATDVAVLLLPFWLLHPMKIPLGRRVGIALVLMAGGFALAVSIVRLIITIQSSTEMDITYEWGNSIKWSLIDSWSGIICACLPCIKPLLARYFPSFPLWAILQDEGSSSKQELRPISV